jgi:hypothetical protein
MFWRNLLPTFSGMYAGNYEADSPWDANTTLSRNACFLWNLKAHHYRVPSVLHRSLSSARWIQSKPANIVSLRSILICYHLWLLPPIGLFTYFTPGYYFVDPYIPLRLIGLVATVFVEELVTNFETLIVPAAFPYFQFRSKYSFSALFLLLRWRITVHAPTQHLRCLTDDRLQSLASRASL